MRKTLLINHQQLELNGQNMPTNRGKKEIATKKTKGPKNKGNFDFFNLNSKQNMRKKYEHYPNVCKVNNEGAGEDIQMNLIPIVPKNACILNMLKPNRYKQ